MNKSDVAIITAIDRTEFKCIGLTVLKGYSDEDDMFDSYEFKYVNTHDILNRLREDNKYNIEIRQVRLGRDRSYRAKVYWIPFRTCMEFCSEYEAEHEGASRVICSRDGRHYIGMSPITKVGVGRAYVIEHYAQDGREVFWYDRKGGKSSRPVLFAASKQANDILGYKIYDGCATVNVVYVDYRDLH